MADFAPSRSQNPQSDFDETCHSWLMTTWGTTPHMTTLVGVAQHGWSGQICDLSHLWVSFLSKYMTREINGNGKENGNGNCSRELKSETHSSRSSGIFSNKYRIIHHAYVGLVICWSPDCMKPSGLIGTDREQKLATDAPHHVTYWTEMTARSDHWLPRVWGLNQHRFSQLILKICAAISVSFMTQLQSSSSNFFALNFKSKFCNFCFQS